MAALFTWFRSRRKPTPASDKRPSDNTAAGSVRRLGKRAHLADSPYILPVDEEESHRLDFNHYLFHQLLRGNYIAPVNTPDSVLDVGCGTGRWAVEMAQTFPNANVVALDLVAPADDSDSAPAGSTHPRPDNYTFVQADVFNGLPFADASFAFTHMRMMYLSIPANRWDDLVRDLVRVTKPGGWVELMEAELPINGGPATQLTVDWVAQVCQMRGIDPMRGTSVGRMLQSAGVSNVRTHHVPLPVGRYGGHLGVMGQTLILAAASALEGPIIAQGITSAERFRATQPAVREEMEHGPAQCVYPYYIACGQRLW
jgi:ubiquinone/menaquinone biosynthesis C-methylase UbiE